MKSNVAYLRSNVDVLIAAVQARDARAIDLDAPLDLAPDNAPLSLPGLILRLSHFCDLGVLPLGALLEVPAASAGRDLRLPAETLRMLFGGLGRHDPVDVLPPGYGQGDWDEAMLKWFATAPSHKQLLLARLLYAREVIQGNDDGDVPACAPRYIRVALALPSSLEEPGYFRRNLEALLALAEGVAADRLALPAWSGGNDGAEVSLVRLVAESPYFHKRGVRVDPSSGLPAMFDDEGLPLGLSACLVALFGTFGKQEAFDVLFAGYGAGVWDGELMASRLQPPTHKQLALARLQRALGASPARAAATILRVPVREAG